MKPASANRQLLRANRFSVIVLASALALGACSSSTTSATETAASSLESTTELSAETTAPASTALTAPTASPEISEPTTSSSQPSSSQPSSSQPSSSAPSAGCTTGNTSIPDGAAQGPIVDVDGDMQPDNVWIASAVDGTVTVGVVTAAGGGVTRRFESASPVSRSVLVVDADQRPPVEILASTGRSVQLWVFQDCSIVDVTNPQGQPYQFSLGFTDIGTGVGCVTVGGQQKLVGLDAKTTGNTVNWSRTVVELDGTHARNGATTTGTFTAPGDDQRIDLLHQVTCGALTMSGNGISAPL